MSVEVIVNQLKRKRILVLGFGKEGKSSYQFIRKHLPTVSIVVADENPELDTQLFENDSLTKHIFYDAIREDFSDYDIVLKSPGICLKDKYNRLDFSKISSQTDLFLQAFSPQCVGITGTKGKSTTTSLIFHIINNLRPNSLIAGNIGIPLFDVIEQIDLETKIIVELSAHQLEFIRKAPHISILLNLFEEHLDHYNSYEDYQSAKFNIARCQSAEDYFIYNANDPLIASLLSTKPVKSHCIPFSNELLDAFVIDDFFPLKGEHNLENVAAAIAALNCIENVDNQKIKELLYSFKPLPHRLEFIGEVDGVFFYNDSISTVPQASIAAVKALKSVNTIILGGTDRGIDYSPLVDFFKDSDVENFIFTGKAGKRMMRLFEKLQDKKQFYCSHYEEVVKTAKVHTQKGAICLLSPAAASYDQFKNFEHRGDAFRELVIGV